MKYHSQKPERTKEEQEKKEEKNSNRLNDSASKIQKSMDFICVEVVQKIIYTDSFIGIQPV